MKNRSENARVSRSAEGQRSEVHPLPPSRPYLASHTFQRRTITQGV